MAERIVLSDLPTEVANALLVPVYEDMGEEDALDGMADVIVQRQLDLLTQAGWSLEREGARNGSSGTSPQVES